MRRALAAAFLLLFVVVSVAWRARITEGRRALAQSDSALARGDFAEAIMSARAAAEARCPAFCASELGYARLYAMAKDAETRGDDLTAFAAWRAARAASLATSVLSSHGEARARADGELARIGHRLDAAAAAAGSPGFPAASEERLRSALSTNDVPSGAAYALVAAGGALFLFGAARFASPKKKNEKAALPTTDLAVVAGGAVLCACGVLFF